MKVRRDEETKFERKIVFKCKEPKMFHKIVNKNLKINEGVERLKEKL